MWKAERIICEVRRTTKNQVLRSIKKHIEKDGFSYSVLDDSEIIVETPSTFLGKINHRLKLEEQTGSVVVSEDTLASQKLHYLLYFGILFLLLPSLAVMVFQTTLSFLILLGFTIVWVFLFLSLGKLEPISTDYTQRLENAKIIERNNRLFPIILLQLFLGYLPFVIHILNPWTLSFTGKAILYPSFFVLFLFALGWQFFDPWIRQRFGIVGVGFGLQIVGLFFPVNTLVVGAIYIPAFDSLLEVLIFVLISISCQYLVLVFVLISLYRMDEDYFRVPMFKHPAPKTQDNSQGLTSKTFATLTVIGEMLFYLIPLGLLGFYFPKIRHSMVLLYNKDASIPLIAVFLLILFLPFFFEIAGIFTSIRSRKGFYSNLRDQVAASGESDEDEKKVFVKNLFRAETKKNSVFRKGHVIFVDSDKFDCTTIPTGPLSREAYLVISDSTVDRFRKEELKAFIYHEIHHLRQDSLLLVSLRYFSQFLLLGSGILTVFVDFPSREKLADLFAAKMVGTKKFIKALEKLRKEKVKRELSAWAPQIGFLGEREKIHPKSWVREIYWKIYGNYILLYSHPSLKERMEFLENVT